MNSVAATWAGSGAPPPLTAGDVETMAARRAGFDASLQPGWKAGDRLESDHVAKVAAANAKPAPAAKKPAAKALAQKKADPAAAKAEEKPEPTAK